MYLILSYEVTMGLTKEHYKSITPQQWAVIIETMDNFDFDKVESHMNAVNWRWSLETEYRVPNQTEIRAALRSMLIRAYDTLNLEKQCGGISDAPHYCSCGGFTVYVWPNDMCQVFFSVTDLFIDDEYIKEL